MLCSFLISLPPDFPPFLLHPSFHPSFQFPFTSRPNTGWQFVIFGLLLKRVPPSKKYSVSIIKEKIALYVRCPTAGRVGPWCPPCAPPSLSAPPHPRRSSPAPRFPLQRLRRPIPCPPAASVPRPRPGGKKFEKSRRKIWSIRKKRVTLHSLFGTEVPRRPQKMETPPGVEKFEKKIAEKFGRFKNST